MFLYLMQSPKIDQLIFQTNFQMLLKMKLYISYNKAVQWRKSKHINNGVLLSIETNIIWKEQFGTKGKAQHI